MLQDQYVIVTLPDLRSGDLGASVPDAKAVPQVEVAELSQAEVRDLQRDSRKRLAPTMPWTLIEPVTAPVMAAASGDGAAAAGVAAWGIDAVGATSSPFDGSGIVVAVLDTGIDPQHPAFAGVALERRNFTSEGDDDSDGHGTHCAGTIFGQDVAGTRIGVARKIKRALIGKVLGQGGTTQSIVEAINWAVSAGAHVISMSFRIDFQRHVANLMQVDGLAREPATSVALEAYRKNVTLYTDVQRAVLALRALSGDGIVMVAAAGNESRRPQYTIAAYPPAAVTDMIAVGALGQGPNGCTVADFSNTEVTLAAPGANITSARAGGGLVALNGTSMAAPHAAGVAALWAQRQLAADGRINSARLAAELIARSSKDRLDGAHRAPADVGAGIVQAPQH